MSERITLRRSAKLPDPIRVARCRRAPELGPRILFLSGGDALRKLCRTLKLYTHNSIHLITPFDSGGSSARLRDAFGMLSVGDLRNRLMALADESVRGNPEIYRLFSCRFPEQGEPAELRARLDGLVSGADPLVAELPAPMQQIVQTQLRWFAERMPADFDLRVASVGNLMLAGTYLSHDRDIDSVIFLFSKLVGVRGVVGPIVDVHLHLGAELEGGGSIVGQHRLTGKEVEPIESPVVDLFLVSADAQPRRTEVCLADKVRHLFFEAEVICYSMGSFYTSIIANLLPRGVGRTIVEADCPKMYVANTGVDPEQRGMSVADCVDTLLRFVRNDAGADTPANRIIDFVLVDRSRGIYESGVDCARIDGVMSRCCVRAPACRADRV